jgi:hypothetical protein
MTAHWKILNKYPFELIPGTAKEMPDGDLSYYEYLNGRWMETGKNVMAIAWLLRNFPEGLSYSEPFGGCGVFSVAIQERMKPSEHRISELDEDCVAQLHHALGKYSGVSIHHENAHDTLGTLPADVYVCDFPFFTLIKHETGYWAEELARMVAQKPKAILITDGASCRYHFTAKALRKRGYDVTADRETYAYAFDKMVQETYGYHVTGMVYHGTCFYIRIEPQPVAPIEFLKLEAGVGPNGLRPDPKGF